MCLRIKAFALTGRGDSSMRKPQGVASLALGYVHHWAFSPSLLNPKFQFYIMKLNYTNVYGQRNKECIKS